jgi:hypothetical protein
MEYVIELPCPDLNSVWDIARNQEYTPQARIAVLWRCWIRLPHQVELVATVSLGGSAMVTLLTRAMVMWDT